MVQKKLPLINSAHGSDTRNIINELIKLFNGMGYTYNEALNKAHNVLDEAKQTNDMNTHVNNRLDNIIAESGTSSTEVVDARGTHTVLSGRLNEINQQIGSVSLLGSNYRSLSETVVERGVNVKNFGAVGDGVSDDTDAVKRAVEHVGTGRIIFPKGAFVVEGLPIKNGLHYEGMGKGVTSLRLPEDPEKHMFIGEGVIHSASVINLSMRGASDGYSNFNGMDFSEMGQLDNFDLINCRVERFNIGYKGTDNDRWAFVSNNLFYFNKIGMYGGEHPIIIGNDFRYNDVGLTGRLNDLYSLHNKFNNGRVGVEPADGQYIRNAFFSLCGFWRNSEKGLEINENNIVDNCRFNGVNDGDIGILLSGRSNSIMGSQFCQGVSTAFGVGCIVLGAVGGSRQDINIADNLFILNSPGVVSINPTTTMAHFNFKDNTVYSNGAQVLKSSDDGLFYNGSISGNSIRYEGSMTDDLFSIPNTTVGFMFADNSISTQSSSSLGYVINADLRESQVLGNRFRLNGAKQGVVNLINSNPATMFDNNYGLATKRESSVTVPEGVDFVDVEHGLDLTPYIYKAHLTPINVSASRSEFWVSQVTDTHFRVNAVREGNGAKVFGYSISR